MSSARKGQQGVVSSNNENNVYVLPATSDIFSSLQGGQSQTVYVGQLGTLVTDDQGETSQVVELAPIRQAVSTPSVASAAGRQGTSGPAPTEAGQGQSLMYFATDLDSLRLDNQDEADSDEPPAASTEVEIFDTTVDLNTPRQDSTLDLEEPDSEPERELEPESMDAAESDGADFECSDYTAPVKPDEVVNEHLSRVHQESSAALRAIALARRDLEEEIRRREAKVRDMRNEVDRLMRELREVKQLERAEMKKLNLASEATQDKEKRALNYRIIRGRRYTSTLYEASDGHIYMFKRHNSLICVLSKFKGLYCQGWSRITATGLMQQTRDHNHGPHHPDLEKRRLINQVRMALRADEHQRTVREVFDDVVGSSPHAHLLPFKSLYQTLRKDKMRKDREGTMPGIKNETPAAARGSSSRPENRRNNGPAAEVLARVKQRASSKSASAGVAKPETSAATNAASTATAGEVFSRLCQSVTEGSAPEDTEQPHPSQQSVPQPGAPHQPTQWQGTAGWTNGEAVAEAAEQSDGADSPAGADDSPGPSSPSPPEVPAAEAPHCTAATPSRSQPAALPPGQTSTPNGQNAPPATATPQPAPSAFNLQESLQGMSQQLKRNLSFVLKDSEGRDLVMAFIAPAATMAAKKSLNGYDIQLDGSTKLSTPVAGVFSHLLLVSVCLRRQLRPAFLVLLRESSQAVLLEVFAALKRRLGGRLPDNVVCSSEPTLLSAAAAGWPDAQISCSISTYCRDVVAKVVRENLSAQFVSSVPVRNWLIMLLALPLMPPQKMGDALEKLTRDIPEQVDSPSRQALRRLGTYVTEEWLWKFGPAKMSVHRRPCMDELDTFQLMRDLKSRYQACRDDASADTPRAQRDFVALVAAVNQVLRDTDSELEVGQEGLLCWPRMRKVDPLVRRMVYEKTSALQFLKRAGAELLAGGLPPGSGIEGGDAAVTAAPRPVTGASRPDSGEERLQGGGDPEPDPEPCERSISRAEDTASTPVTVDRAQENPNMARTEGTWLVPDAAATGPPVRGRAGRGGTARRGRRSTPVAAATKRKEEVEELQHCYVDLERVPVVEERTQSPRKKLRSSGAERLRWNALTLTEEEL
ncbi:uncharacterized protein LOC122367469 [Amphibalanus amphitrite]|uniref:uncharacterized protein LOC122367469 n=1 Tax=Amphibalanus amphitrite TaxID=1232801 RepID=UPI001C91169B|nr:uncharacterized protein LOC122367469 [Amphibalanus amphitrite]